MLRFIAPITQLRSCAFKLRTSTDPNRAGGTNSKTFTQVAMRDWSYEVQILHSNGNVFHEYDIKQKRYIRADAGQEYKIAMRILPDEDGEYPANNSCAVISIDGACTFQPMYFCLDENSPDFCDYIVFQGFHQGGNTYQAIQFAVASKHGTPERTDSKQGCIRVDFFETEPQHAFVPIAEPPTPPHTTLCNDTDKSDLAGLSAPQNVKYLQTPSLTSCPGRVVDDEASWGPMTRVRFRILRQIPDAVFEIWYHSADKLNFLQEFHAAQTARRAANAVPLDLTGSEVIENHAWKDFVTPASRVVGYVDLTKFDGTPVDLTADLVDTKLHFYTPSPVRDAKRSANGSNSGGSVESIASSSSEKENTVLIHQNAEPTSTTETGQKPKKRSRASGADSLVKLARML